VKVAADAVQYAHDKGVIHRDLKPGNILLDKDGKPRVTDFGLAKLTESGSDLTGTGQILGTPSYMPPEQAAAQVSAVGRLSDVYSLGAILYCLLTGRPPFQAANPLETLLQVQKQDPVPPQQLNPNLPLDLDTIVLKCLDKVPTRRYVSAKALAEELQRYLAGRPILARPVGRLERFWRWCRREPIVAGLSGAFAAALIAGTAVSTYFAIEANVRAKSESQQRQMADQERRAANLQETRAIAAQEQSVDSLKDALAAVEQMLTRVAQERLANVPQMEPVRKELMEDALKFYQKFLRKNNNDPLIRREAAGAYRRMADIYRALGRSAEAEECYRKAFELFDELEAESSLEPDMRRDLSTAHIEVAYCCSDLGMHDEQEKHNWLAVEIAENLMQEFPQDPQNHDQLAFAALHLALQIDQTRPDEAEKLLERNLTLTKNAVYLGASYGALGGLWTRQGRYSQAEPVLRQSVALCEKVALEQPSANWAQGHLGFTLISLSNVLAAGGRLPEAEEIGGRAIRILDKLAIDYPAGPNYRNLQVLALQTHAGLLRKLNRAGEAANDFRRSLDVSEKLADDFPANRGFAQAAFDRRLELGQFLVEAGRKEAALDVYREAIDIEESRAADFPIALNYWNRLVSSHVTLGRLFAKGGQTEEAETAYHRAVEIQETLERNFRDKPEDRRDLAQSHLQAAEMLVKIGRWEEAEKICRLAVESHAKLTADFPNESMLRANLANCYSQLHEILAAQGQLRDAEQALYQSAAIWKELAADFPEVAAGRQGHLLAEQGRWEEAVAAFSRAIELRSEDLDGVWLPLALLRLKVGQTEDYRRLVSTALDRFGATEELAIATNLGILAKLAPGSSDDVDTALKVLELALAHRPDGLALAIRAHLLVRAGRAAEGVPIIEGMVAATPDGQGDQRFNLLYLALGRHQLGRDMEALEAYRAAELWQDRRFNAWFHRIDFDRTCDELELLLLNWEKLVRLIWFPRFSPDGKWLLTAHGSWETSERGEARLFAVQDGAVEHVLKHPRGVRTVAWSSQSTFFVTGGYEGIVRFFDPLTGEQSFELNTGDDVENVRISPADELLITLHGSGDVRVYELPSRNELHHFKGVHQGGIWGMAISPNSKLVVTAGKDSFVRIIDLAARKIVHEFRHPAETNGVAFTPDSRYLATGCADSLIRLFDLNTGEEQAQYKGHDHGTITDLQFNSDGNLLASAGGDRTVRLWDVSNLKQAVLTKTLRGHTGIVFGVAISPDDRSVASGGWDGQVKMWDLQTGDVRWTWPQEQTTDARPAQGSLPASRMLEGHTATVWCAAWSPDGTILATGSDDKSIRLWDGKSGAPLKTLAGHKAQVRHVAFSRDGTSLASGSFDNTIRLWDPKTGDLRETLDDTAGVYFVAYSKDGKRLVAASAESSPRVWNVPERTPLWKLEGHAGRAWAVAMSPRDDLIASAGTDRLVKIWKADSGEIVHTLAGHRAPVGSVAFSPNGRIVASAGGHDGTARLWDSATGEPVYDPLPCGVVYEVAFSADGSLLATSCADETVRVWDVKKGALRHTFAGGGLCVAFSPDGKRLAGGGGDKLVYLWDLPALKKIP
jgi:WD40 repeat protein/tetratricopeptide (TPR) repeat protein